MLKLQALHYTKKFKIPLLIVCSNFSSLFGEIYQQRDIRTVVIEKFQHDLDEFFPNVGWVAQDFLVMTPDELTRSWSEIVRMLRTKAWYYVCNDPNEFNQDHFRDSYLGQCRAFHEFFRNIYLDFVHDRLEVIDSKDVRSGHVQTDLVPLVSYWYSDEKTRTVMYDFYAFYFDRMAEVLVELINEADWNRETSDYYVFSEKSISVHDRLVDVYEFIKGSRHEHIYAAKARRFKSLIELLIKEHDQK